MARNRRQSESMTFAIGRGCFLLLAGVVCVGFSFIKIIVGSEYVSKCPSREMIPVYIIVSGCLPVLLSALRQPYDSGHEMEKDKWSMNVALIIAIIGVMVNLAWLIAGTYLVVTVWSGTICSISALPTPDPGTMSHNGTMFTTNGTSFSQNISNWNSFNSSELAYKANDNKDEVTQLFNETEKMEKNNNKSVDTTVAPKPSKEETVQISNGPDESTSVKPKTEIIRNKTLAPINDEVKTNNLKNSKNGTNILHNMTDFIEMDLDMIKENATKQDEPCINCDMHILRFSLAVIIIDWLFVLVGIVYFCNFVLRRFSSITGKLLSVNT